MTSSCWVFLTDLKKSSIDRGGSGSGGGGGGAFFQNASLSRMPVFGFTSVICPYGSSVTCVVPTFWFQTTFEAMRKLPPLSSDISSSSDRSMTLPFEIG